jgi:GT2 family glycosyltransferase
MAVELSVVLATYQRRTLLTRLLDQLGRQTFGSFEVVVVDDGSTEPACEFLEPRDFPFPLRVLTQRNGGAASARHRGILEAKGELLVIVDDDMQVGHDFLQRHVDAHPPGSRRAVLGRICADPQVAHMPLFERWYAWRLDAVARTATEGTQQLEGSALYTGNVSMRRADYLAVGGFDPLLQRSEDAELGLRLEEAGVEFGFAPLAVTLHGSDHTSEATWLRRAFNYGVFDSRIRTRHPTKLQADPWRLLFKLRAPVRPLLAAVVLAPNATRPVSRALLAATHLVDAMGLARVAYAGSAVAYSMEYFRGVRDEAGSLWASVDALAHHVGLRRQGRRPAGGAHVRPAAR